MIAVVALIVMVAAEVVGYIHAEHAEKAAAQSWDQANLKRHDKGCPTAIYVAPDGVLEQCR